MSTKPVPAILPVLAVFAGVPLVLLVAAIAATRFGGVELALTYDLVTWQILRWLSWAALAGAVLACIIALRDLKGRWIYALTALVLAGATVVGFEANNLRLGQPSAQDITSNPEEPPVIAGVKSTPAGPEACSAIHSIPTQMRADQVTSAMVDAGIHVTRATPFSARGTYTSPWFAFRHDVMVRIRPGRTDVRITALEAQPNGGDTCALAAKFMKALEANNR